MLGGLFSRRGAEPGSSGPTTPHLGILRRFEFQRLLDRERCRSDRNAHPFSLVLFDIEGKEAADLRRLCHLLASRIRLTDDVGWFNDDHIGVLLPDTPAAGAWAFVTDLRRSLERIACSVPVRVFTYGGQSHRAMTEEASPQPSAVAPSAGYEEVREPPPAPANAGSVPPAEDMVELFLKPLPWWKRVEDILGSLAALVVFSPLFLLIAIGVKLSSPGPVIYKQKRVGRGGKVFTFYKFRTMYVGAEERKQELAPLNEMDGPVFKIRNDPRVTPFGRFLRRSSLDEIPQLWNVLKGDMTLVGPRPPTPDEVPKYDRWHRRRLEMTGGITGIWQVSGRNEVPFTEWMRMDARYLRTISVWTDLKILVKTIWAVVTGRGAA